MSQSLRSERVRANTLVRRIPAWLKWAHTAFVAAIVPVYLRQYGWRNFLWFSDVALFTTLPALWFERPLPAGMQAVAITVPETGWTVDLFARLFFRVRMLGLADYMFDRRIPRPVRALSLFHLWLPVLLLWMLGRLGYDRRSFAAQTVLTWTLLAATFALTEPADDINWVYGLSGSPQRRMNRRAYLLLVMAVYPVAFHWPAHLVFCRMFPPPDGQHPGL
jgi:hypothetical protein